MNISATLNVARLVWSPHLCLPQVTAANFNELKFPFHSSIKAVVVDKDNCFAKDHDDKVWPEYEANWARLKSAYPGARLLIVSNSAGTNDDAGHAQAKVLEAATGVKVLRHSTKKPGCHGEIMDYFYRNKVVSGPGEVAIIGDRLFTDVMMANLMGSYGVWLKDGVKRSESVICRLERQLYGYLTKQ